MISLSNWLETEFLQQANKDHPHWAQSSIGSIKGVLFCDSILVHDGVKAGQCSPGTVEAGVRLEITELGKEPVVNNQSMLIGRLPPEILNHPAPAPRVIESFLGEIDKKFSQALERNLKHVGKKFQAYELMPTDLLVRPDPIKILLKHLEKSAPAK